MRRYRGKKLSDILSDIETRTPRKLPDTFETTYREHVSALFARSLKPMPNVISMLESLDCAKCIASSGPLKKIEQALDVCGLANYFGSNLYSSYVVGSWKPEPDLFLHAARSMGYEPASCIVVEDSTVGLQAAKAAGMEVLYYAPQSIEKNDVGATVFKDMLLLPGLIRALRSEKVDTDKLG